MSKPKNTPASCVCYDDPNWNAMVPVCRTFDASKDGLCESCDHAQGCHVSEEIAEAMETWAKTPKDYKAEVTGLLASHQRHERAAINHGANVEHHTLLADALEAAYIILKGDES